MRWSSEVALLFSQEAGVGGNVVSQIVDSAVQRGIFDQDMYTRHGVLTSASIQENYLAAVKRRKKFEFKTPYRLVQIDQKPYNACNSSDNASTNDENVCKTSIDREIDKIDIERDARAEARSAPAAAIFGEIGELYTSNISAAPSVAECKAMAAWAATYPAWAIKYAIEQAAQAGKKFPQYVNAILRRIKADGITDPMQLRKQPSGNGAALRDIAERDYANRHQYTQKDYEAMYTDIFAGREDDHARE